MPISVLPTPPDFSPSNTNGYEPVDYGNGAGPGSDSIAALKSRAKVAALQSAKGASAIALLSAARNQYLQAGVCEGQGDLKGALTAFTMAAQLANMVFATSEFQGKGAGSSASGSGTGVKKEFTDFMEDSINLTSRMQAVEAKLKSLEKQNQQQQQQPSSSPTTPDGPVSKPGGSIADRMRALQNSGLSISTTSNKVGKRISKDLNINLNGIASPDPSSGFPSPLFSGSPKTSSLALGSGSGSGPTSGPELSSPSSSALSTLTALSAPSTVPGSPLANIPTTFGFTSSSLTPSSSAGSIIPSSNNNTTSSNPFHSISSSSASHTSASQNHANAHAFVSPSTLGPPSPGSSPSSSPTLSFTVPSSFSSSASTPSNHRYSVSEFNTQFPSIDELDELDGLDGAGFASTSTLVGAAVLPSVPTGRSTTSNRSSGSAGIRPTGTGNTNRSLRSINTGSAGSLKKDNTGANGVGGTDAYPSSSPGTAPGIGATGASPTAPLASPAPHTALRNFIVPVERPSSTPITPTRTQHIASGPNNGRTYGNFDDDEFPGSSVAGVVPPSASFLPSANANAPSASSSRPNSSTNASNLPISQKNTCTPHELHSYLHQNRLGQGQDRDRIKVLLLDVRERAEFDRGHIRAGAVCCVEPEILRREHCTSDTIEDSLVIAPASESSTFNNRHKFELVVIYDRCSTSFTNSPHPNSLAANAPNGAHGVGASFGVNQNQSNASGSNPDISLLLRAIWEREFKKSLKRMPMMLIGGYEGWMKEFGEGEVTSVSSASTTLSSGALTNGNTRVNNNPFAPGGALASPALGGSFNLPDTPGSQPQPISGGSGSSRTRAGTSPSSAPAHRSNHSVDQGYGNGNASGSGSGYHSRAPAEANSTSTFISHPNVNSNYPSTSTSSTRSGRATPTPGPGPAPLSPHSSGSGSATGRRPQTVRASFSSSSTVPNGNSGTMSSLPEGASMISPPMSPTILNGATPITYPSFGSSSATSASTYPYSIPSASSSSVNVRSPGSVPLSSPYDRITSPPQASINPSLSSRRRTSDYVDQSQEALSGALSPGSGPVPGNIGGVGGMVSPGGSYPHGLSSSGNGFGGHMSMNGMNGYGGGNMNGYNGSASLNSGGYNGMGSGGVGANGHTLSLSSLPRKPIDYPELSASISSAHQIVRPPPAAAAGALERQDNRMGSSPAVGRAPASASSLPAATGVSYPATSSSPSKHLSSTATSATISSSNPYSSAALTKLTSLGLPPPQSVPKLGGSWPPRYWADSPIGTSGLKNLGNTCYMNAPIQCLSATAPFARFFTEVDLKTVINYMNKMNSQGQLTKAFSKLVHDIWHGDMPYIAPNDFRRTLCSLNKQYIGTDQHDSQEFLSFLLDGIHEDTNRIMAKKSVTRTPEEEERLELLPQQVASDYEWQVWKQSNDSIIVDFFQGQFRNQLRCMSCHKTSTTYNAFSILSLPVPARTGKIPLQSCLKAFFNVEVMEGDDAWDCTRCKLKRRATKTLSLARLPPVLVIHFKRFEANGRFSDKIDTFVDYPLKSLDLTDLMPPPLPPGADQSLLNGGLPMSREDPRTQLGPYKYDLYGVTNHYGNLSSGHYTAFVASRGGWLYCDDSSVKNVDAKQVVNQKAYFLFYKRTKA